MSDNNLLRIFTVDSFSSKPFSGNPAAVCLDDTPEGLLEETMQNIAAEMNISETAFIRKRSIDDQFQGSDFGLRWFTPTNEVPLCGHATLASAAVLFYSVDNRNDEVSFDTKSGILKARKVGPHIGLDLPVNAPHSIDREKYKDLIQHACGDVCVEEVQYSPDTRKLLIRISDSCSRATLEGLRPAIDQFMGAEKSGDVRGVMLTLRGSPVNGSVDSEGGQYDFISRYFSPWNGIPEDPVTGSAHTVLAPYWSEVLGKKKLYACQYSKRGGELSLELREDGRLNILGRATVVLQGTFQWE